MAVYTDTFTNSNSTALTAHNANWAVPTGATGCRVFNNTAVSSSGNDSVNYWNQAVGAAQYAKTTFVSGQLEPACGPAVRVQSGADSYFYALVNTSGTVFCGQCIAGTATNWDSGQTGWAAGDTVELHTDPSTSTTFHLKRNGTTIATYTGKSALSGGFVGIAVNSNFQAVGADNWEGGDVTPSSSQATRSMHQFRLRRSN